MSRRRNVWTHIAETSTKIFELSGPDYRDYKLLQLTKYQYYYRFIATCTENSYICGYPTMEVVSPFCWQALESARCSLDLTCDAGTPRAGEHRMGQSLDATLDNVA